MHTGIVATTTNAFNASSYPQFLLPTEAQPTQPSRTPTLSTRLPLSVEPEWPMTSMVAVAVSQAPAPASSSRHSSPTFAQRSPFQTAVHDGDATAVKRMIQAGMGDCNTIDVASGLTALMLAARCGHDDVVLILCKGASAEDGRLVQLLTLMDVPATADSMPASSALVMPDSMLMRAADLGDLTKAQALLDAGADAGIRNHEGKTAARMAMDIGHELLAMAMDSVVARAGATSTAGTTNASSSRSSTSIQLDDTGFPAPGAKAAIKSNSGRTALSAARAANHQEIVKLLRDYGVSS